MPDAIQAQSQTPPHANAVRVGPHLVFQHLAEEMKRPETVALVLAPSQSQRINPIRLDLRSLNRKVFVRQNLEATCDLLPKNACFSAMQQPEKCGESVACVLVKLLCFLTFLLN